MKRLVLSMVGIAMLGMPVLGGVGAKLQVVSTADEVLEHFFHARNIPPLPFSYENLALQVREGWSYKPTNSDDHAILLNMKSGKASRNRSASRRVSPLVIAMHFHTLAITETGLHSSRERYAPTSNKTYQQLARLVLMSRLTLSF